MTERLVLVADIDGTLTGDDAALQQLLSLLASKQIPLVCATGRHYQSARLVLAEHGVPLPTALITDVGCRVWPGSNGEDQVWAKHIRRNWDRKEIQARLSGIEEIISQDIPLASIRLGYRVRREAGPVEQVVPKVRAAVGAEARVVISGDCIDVLPTGAGKGPAVRHVLYKLGFDPATAVAAGDSGNDADMLTGPGAGIIVGNAWPELAGVKGQRVYRARASHAAGIIEGLQMLTGARWC